MSIRIAKAGPGWKCLDCNVIMMVEPYEKLVEDYGKPYADSHNMTPCACCTTVFRSIQQAPEMPPKPAGALDFMEHKRKVEDDIIKGLGIPTPNKRAPKTHDSAQSEGYLR